MLRVFGELRLNYRSLSWLTVAGMVASLTALLDDGLNLGITVLIAGASVVAQTPVFLAALWLIPRALARAPLLLAPLLMVSGFIRGFSLSWLSIGELETAFAQAANASVTNLVWGTVALTLIAQREKFDLAYRQQAAQLLISPRNFKVGSQPEMTQLTARLREIVRELSSTQDPKRDLLETLSQEIRAILEPLQLRLSVGKSLRPQIGVRRLIWSSLKNLRPSPLFAVITWTTLNLGGAFSLFGPQRASISLAISGLSLGLLLWLANKAQGKLLRNLLVVVAVLIPTLLADLVMTSFGLESGLGELAVFPFSPIACFALMVLSSGIRLIGEDRERLLGRLRSLTSPSSDVGDYVHSSVQGVLLSLVSKFLGLRNPTEHDFQDLAQELNEFLSRDFDDEFSKKQLGPEERLRVLISNWAPLVSLEISESFLGSASVLVRQQALMVLEEGIRNASRHAAATWVTAESRLVSQDRFQITIISDRNNPPTSKSQGGGQRMLDKICISWRLELSSSRTKLTADLLVF